MNQPQGNCTKMVNNSWNAKCTWSASVLKTGARPASGSDFEVWGCSAVVRCLLSIPEALGSLPRDKKSDFILYQKLRGNYSLLEVPKEDALTKVVQHIKPSPRC